MLDCQGLDNLDLGYWDVMPKSIRVNCSRYDITFPLTVYGVDRNALDYRVLNPEIASVNASGEVTLGPVRGVTMILAWKRGDLCDIRYVQVSVECPCDVYLPGDGGDQSGGDGSPDGGADSDCSDCVENCDGAESFTIIVSGFTGACQGHNGTHVLVRVGPCVWVNAAGTVQVRCYAGQWRVEVGIGTQGFAEDYPAALACSGDHPTGSGTLVSSACGQTGHYTIS